MRARTRLFPRVGPPSAPRERMIARRPERGDTAAKAAGPEPRPGLGRAPAAVGDTSADVSALFIEPHPASGRRGPRRCPRHSAGSALRTPHPHLRGSCSRRSSARAPGPARRLILLPVLGRSLLPRRGNSATPDGLVLLARVPLSGHLHDGGIDDLTAASDIAIRLEVPVELSNSRSMMPAWASFSRNNDNVGRRECNLRSYT